MTEAERARALIWKHTHRDFRSDAGEPRAILVLRAGATTVVPLELLTEEEVARLLPPAQRSEARAAERRVGL